MVGGKGGEQRMCWCGYSAPVFSVQGSGMMAISVDCSPPEVSGFSVELHVDILPFGMISHKGTS